MKTRTQACVALYDLTQFISVSQGKCIAELTRGEERNWYFDKLCEMAEIVRTMAKTYEQDGKGKDAIVYLHYFTPGSDCWITEKDMGDEQAQAFGYASLNGFEPEMGYISIAEWLENGAELDLHFTPRKVAEVEALNGKGSESMLIAGHSESLVDTADDY